VINLPKIQQAHKRFKQEHAATVQRELEAAGQVGEDHPRQFATFKHRTGALANATKAKVVRTSGGHLVRILNPKKYAAAIDSGARPHRIEARRARFLRFVAGGKVIYRRAVNHPGNKPYKFLYRARNAAYRVAGPNLEAGMARIAKKF
jgi:hypothetical protein